MLAALAAGAPSACGSGARRAPVHLRPVANAVVDNAEPAVPRPAPAARPAPPPPPGAATLAAALNRLFAQAGPASGGSVYDLTDHVSLYALRSGVARPPASVEKLYTSVAVLDDLGPDARLQTTVLGAGWLGRRGVWHGDLYVRGGGDPTFGDSAFNRVWEFGYGPTATELVGQLRADGIKSVSGWVDGDGSLFDSRPGPPSMDFRPDIPDLGGQLSALTFDHGSTAGNLSAAAFAARQVARTMTAMGIEARASRWEGTAPAKARQLATVYSPPMSVMLRLMDVPSDDFFAEMFAKQLGARFGGAGTTAAGARVIRSAITRYGIDPQIVDGSGLSRSDLTSPRQVVEFLNALSGTPVGDELDSALPIVGINGTVQTIAAKTVARNRCIAKTGTLNNVTNLAGYCHALGHKLLSFALFVDGPSNAAALQLESKMVAAIARM